MDAPEFGVWRLTDKGRSTILDGPTIDTIFERVQKLKSLKRSGEPKESVAPASTGADALEEEQEEQIAPSPETSAFSDHRLGLIDLISRMSSGGFERFCSELLSRVGVEEVQTTQLSRDRGIDGSGRLRINEFVTTPIAFQSKKYEDKKVSSEKIQRFRGAMHGNIGKGIFFTTSSFTADARTEARSPGKVEVELVDLPRILEICEKFKIGLFEQQILILQPEFFERFLK